MKAASWIAVVLGCLLVAAGLGYYKYRQIQAAIAFGASFPEPVEAVEAAVVAEEFWQPTAEVTGEAVAPRAVDLSSELAGRIVEVSFAPGAAVDRGQVLVRLDTSEEQAQLAAARAEAELARMALSRNERLMLSGAAAEEARDTARAQYAAATAAVQRLQAIIDKKTLRAPFDARAGLHELGVGQYLDRGTVITRLVGRDGEMWVDFTLPQQHARVAVGVPVRLSVSGATLSASIIARDAFVNERSRNVSFRALAGNESGVLYPGMLVAVSVPIGDPQRAALVPATAIRRDAFGAHVYVLAPAEEGARAPERALRRPVVLGPQRGDRVVVVEGLRVGERVAAAGSFKLRDGALSSAKAGAAEADRQGGELARE